MALRLCSYNVEHFNRLFRRGSNALSASAADQARIQAIGDVLGHIDADLIGVLEAPNTTTTTPDESTVARLEAFAADRGLRTSRALTGFISSGSQEIAVLYDPARLTVAHDPDGQAGSESDPPFDERFFHDTDDDRVKEVYEHYRPPLEARVVDQQSGQTFWMLVAHVKSKGVFSAMDLAHWELENLRNRRKIFAECASIRQRIDHWLAAGREVVVMGDINDGPAMDHYEFRFGRSGVELLMGDLFEPERVLLNLARRPKWGSHGWRPSSARFRDRMTEDHVNVLIDHVLVSGGLPVAAQRPHRIWNPYEDDQVKADIGDALRAASDHFPVTLDLA